MIITEICRQRRHLVQLMLDGEPGPLLDATTVEHSPYGVGKQINEEELEALQAQSQYDRTRDRALYLLGLRDYAQKELERKLAQEASAETAARVVARLAELGLLDDAAYAARLARNLSEYKQYSRRHIEEELRRRGIDREIAYEAVQELETDDFQQALALIEKRYYNKMNDWDDRRRVMAALARRGFSFDAVRRAMEVYDQEKSE